MTNKIILIIIMLLIGRLLAYGQSVAPANWISNAHDHTHLPSGVSLHGSLGELAIEHFSAEGLNLSQGFLQTYLQVTSTESTWPEGLVLTIGPNPFTKQFTIEQSSDSPLHLEVYDLYGRLLLSREMLDQRTHIDLSSQAAGTYLLRFWLHTPLASTTTKIIKL